MTLGAALKWGRILICMYVATRWIDEVNEMEYNSLGTER